MYKSLISKLYTLGRSQRFSAAFVAICLVAPTTDVSASWLTQAKRQVVDKPIEWAGRQSGITGTDKKVKDAADETTKTNKQIQIAVTDLKPQLEDTLLHAKATSDGISALVGVLKWPLVGLVVALAAWASGKARAAWKVIPMGIKR